MTRGHSTQGVILPSDSGGATPVPSLVPRPLYARSVRLLPRGNKGLLSTVLRMCLKPMNNWASEASPTLGCSIEISRDIYYVVGMSEYVCHNNVKLTA